MNISIGSSPDFKTSRGKEIPVCIDLVKRLTTQQTLWDRERKYLELMTLRDNASEAEKNIFQEQMESILTDKNQCTMELAQFRLIAARSIVQRVNHQGKRMIVADSVGVLCRQSVQALQHRGIRGRRPQTASHQG